MHKNIRQKSAYHTCKSEMRSTKFETNPNVQNTKFKNNCGAPPVTCGDKHNPGRASKITHSNAVGEMVSRFFAALPALIENRISTRQAE